LRQFREPVHRPGSGEPPGGKAMGRRVIFVGLLVVVGLFLYLGYNSYDAKRAGSSGDVYSKDSAGKVKSEPAGTAASTDQTAVAPPGTQMTQEAAATGDTAGPNPPDGVKYTGMGRYQLYRQGNITWRIDTDTGKTCIIFATDEEWKKPKVYRNGCGRQ
jgi:hypothetical protein